MTCIGGRNDWPYRADVSCHVVCILKAINCCNYVGLFLLFKLSQDLKTNSDTTEMV